MDIAQHKREKNKKRGESSRGEKRSIEVVYLNVWVCVRPFLVDLQTNVCGMCEQHNTSWVEELGHEVLETHCFNKSLSIARGPPSVR